MGIRNHLRLFSVILVGVAAAGLLTVGFGPTPLSGSVLGSMFGLGLKGDFSMISDSPTTVPQSQTGIISVTVTSINHFSGTVSVSATLTTIANIPPVVASSRSSVILTPDQTASFSVTILATTSTTLGQYSITVQGKTSTLSRSITVSADVTPPPPPPTPDFYLYTSSSSLTVTAGAYATSTVTISSFLSYSGNAALTVNVYPSGVNSPGVSLNLTALFLPAAGANTTTLVVNASSASVGYYTIGIAGSSGALNHAISISLSVTDPGEVLSFLGYSFTSPTNATLYVRNLGSSTTSFVSYYVTDYGPDRYTLASWSGPSLAPGQLVGVTVLIGTSCSGCVLTGSAFTFLQGNLYSMTLVTSRNAVFTFSAAPSGQEHLGMDNFGFTSGTNLTMYIRNTGNVPVQLVAYYVLDASGDYYYLSSYPGPTIPLTQVAVVRVTIGSACPGCTLSGNAFSFTVGYSYTIILVTSTSHQFTFSVTR